MDDQLFLMGLENVLDELERVIRSDRQSRERLSSWLANLLSSLSLLAELKRQIGLLRPGPPMTEALPMEEQQAEFARKTQLLSKVFGILTKGMRLAAVGTPLVKFNYPSEKRRTAAVTQQMQEAERNLDLFWKEVDHHVIRCEGKSLSTILSGVLTERELQRTEDWKEPPRTLPFPDIQSLHISTTDLERRTESTIAPDTISEAEAKTKIKTRGVSDESKAGAMIHTEEHFEPNDTTKTPLLTVSKRGYKVFSTLFVDASQAEPPGEVAWSEFLSAMASVGFSVKSLDGSAWIFAPTNDLFSRSIIFHEPHPSTKIPFRSARRFGRRLERAFGWTAASFTRG